MYKNTVDLAQRRARQLWLADLQGAAFAALPPEEQRASLVKAKQRVQEQLAQLPKKSDARRELGLLSHDLDERIRALRGKRKGPPTTAQHFVDVARERLQPFQFKVFMAEASHRARQTELAHG